MRTKTTQTWTLPLGKKLDSWEDIIADSGASENVIYNIALFQSIKEVNAAEVGMADSYIVEARYEREI